jgi:hypothetical protein
MRDVSVELRHALHMMQALKFKIALFCNDIHPDLYFCQRHSHETSQNISSNKHLESGEITPTFRQDAPWDWLDSFPDPPWKQSGRQSESTPPPVIKINHFASSLGRINARPATAGLSTNKLVHTFFFMLFSPIV